MSKNKSQENHRFSVHRKSRGFSSVFEHFSKFRFRKAQVWYTDFMVGVLIFVIALIIYFEYVNNLSKEEESRLEEMVMDAKILSNSLMSEGHPKDWDQSSVKIIGILSDSRINQTKIEEFYDMNYTETKYKFGIDYEYLFYLEDKEGNKIKVEDKEFAGLETNSSIKVAKLNRITIYNNSLIKAVVQIWH